MKSNNDTLVILQYRRIGTQTPSWNWYLLSVLRAEGWYCLYIYCGQVNTKSEHFDRPGSESYMKSGLTTI
jgi:hypothetical protein